MPTKPKVYMDSCCFIELALQVVGQDDPERRDDVWFLKQLLNAALDGEAEILTSTLSIAECTHAKGDTSEDVKSLFKRFLTSGQYILLIQDSMLVAEKARNLRWAHGLSFRGADAIHLASAMELECDEFLTWDQKFHACAKELDDLALSIRYPRETRCLPGEYRQLILAPTPEIANTTLDQEAQATTARERDSETSELAIEQEKANDESNAPADSVHAPSTLIGSARRETVTDAGSVSSRTPNEKNENSPGQEAEISGQAVGELGQTDELTSLSDLIGFLEQCEKDTRTHLSHGAANRLGAWRKHSGTRESLVAYISGLLTGDHRSNGWELQQKGGLSLERIVIEKAPELFNETDRLEAKRTLGLD